MKRLRNDNIKCALLNAIRHPTQKDAYVQHKLVSFKELNRLRELNMQMDEKCRNIHTILYSKYFIQRFIVRETENIDFQYCSDKLIREQFRELFKVRYSGKLEFDQAFLLLLRACHPTHVAAFEELHHRMETLTLTGDELELFYVASTIIDDFVERELQKDIWEFRTNSEKMLYCLEKYRYLSGWAIALLCVSLAFKYIFSGSRK